MTSNKIDKYAIPLTPCYGIYNEYFQEMPNEIE